MSKHPFALAVFALALTACGTSRHSYRTASALPGRAGDAARAAVLPDTGGDPGSPINGAGSSASPAPTPAADSATDLVFSSDPLTLPNADCGTIIVQTQHNHTAVVLIKDRVITLASSSSTGAFYSDALCKIPLPSSQLTIKATSSSAVAYYHDTTVGTPTLTATDPSAAPLHAATQAETTVAAVASKLAFTTPAFSQKDTDCGLLTVASLDAAGNPVAASADLVLDLAAAASGAASSSSGFFSDSACSVATTTVTVATGSASGNVYFKSATGGAQTISATPSADSQLSAASTTVTIEVTPPP